jgi:hypothetical protein
LSGIETGGKASCTVFNAADGRRFRVHLNLGDFARVRMSKMRTTVAAVARVDPASFDMYIGATRVADFMTGFDAGLLPGAVICLRPAASTILALRPQEDETSSAVPRETAAGMMIRSPLTSSSAQAQAATDTPATPSDTRCSDGRDTRDADLGESPAASCLVEFRGLTAQQSDLQQRWLVEAMRKGVVSSSRSQSPSDRPMPSSSPPPAIAASRPDAFIVDTNSSRLCANTSVNGVRPSKVHISSDGMGDIGSPATPRTEVWREQLRALRAAQRATGGSPAAPPAVLRTATSQPAGSMPLTMDLSGVCGNDLPQRVATAFPSGLAKPDSAVHVPRLSSPIRAPRSPPRPAHSTAPQATSSRGPEHSHDMPSDSKAPTLELVSFAPFESRSTSREQGTTRPVESKCSHAADRRSWDEARAQLLQEVGTLRAANAALQARAERNVTAAEAEAAALDRLEAEAEVRRLTSANAALLRRCDALEHRAAAAEAEARGAQEAAVMAAASAGLDVQQTLQLGAAVAECAALRSSNAALAAAVARANGEAVTARLQLEALKGGVRVVVRMRPGISAAAVAPSAPSEVLIDSARGSVVAITTAQTKTFEFTRVHDDRATQADLFEQDVAPLVYHAALGVNVCVLAYGQSGSGKTYTVFGSEQAPPTIIGMAQDRNDETRGFLPRALQLLFQVLAEHHETTTTTTRPALRAFSVDVSVVELYLDQVTDLLHTSSEEAGAAVPAGRSSTPVRMSLGPAPASDEHHRHRQRLERTAAARCAVRVTADGAAVVGATRVAVGDADAALAVVRRAAAARQVRGTATNASSSRSHCIVTVTVTRGGSSESQLVVVDLAGSERVSRSHSAGDALKETQFINKSLAALGDVIAARASTANPHQHSHHHGTSAAGHVPYRNSKLTAILQPCLAPAASVTLLLACVSPTWHAEDTRTASGWIGEANTEETVNTLAFASRARCVRGVLLTRAPLVSSTSTSSCCPAVAARAPSSAASVASTQQNLTAAAAAATTPASRALRAVSPSCGNRTLSAGDAALKAPRHAGVSQSIARTLTHR